jgi:hypothetical protein
MVIRSPIVAEFLSFIDKNPFCENKDVVNHFAQDEVATRLWGRPFRSKEYEASAWNERSKEYMWVRRTKQPISQVYSKLSFFLYKYNNHLVEGGGKMRRGGPCVTELRRDDGRMGYILTPMGMASIADWRQKQEAIAEFEVRVSEAREEIRNRLGV